MEKLQLKDATMNIDGKEFSVECKKISLKVAFDENYGFVLKSFKNSASEREVEYALESQAFAPFNFEKITKIEEEVDLDAPVNGAPASELIVQKNEDEKLRNWTFVDAKIQESIYGGVNVLKLSATAKTKVTKLTLNIIAFPKCSVVRYWFDVENLTSDDIKYEIVPFKFKMNIDEIFNVYRAHWFKGGANTYEYGEKRDAGIGAKSPKIEISSFMTQDYVPMFLITRDYAPEDGFMVEMDYAAKWALTIQKLNDTAINTEFKINYDDAIVEIKANETVQMPVMTIATFSGDLDNLMVELYDWQYRYMWDYTTSDYFAKTRAVCNAKYPWHLSGRLLHEQFAYRLSCMNMIGIKMLNRVGYEVEWDDAGWSALNGWPADTYSGTFQNNYEGPDHRISTRYFNKYGMKRLLWFAGKPSYGLLSTKQGSWGVYEWRTDGLHNESYREEKDFKKTVTNYLDADARRSFHTCAGGQRYSLTFDIQRYGTYHYASDYSWGPMGNYNFSYFTLPDKWGEAMATEFSWGSVLKDLSSGVFHKKFFDDVEYRKVYDLEKARSNLSYVMMSGPIREELEKNILVDLKIYKHLLDNGVAGKWSYMFHPSVFGDREHFYMQRTSNDRKRACIIIRRRPEKRVIIFPKGLNENEKYLVSFQESDKKFKKTGKELMHDGINLESVLPGELIYLNMPYAPGKAKNAPRPEVTRVVKRTENNVGASGVGIYWDSDPEERPIWCYEIAKNGKIITYSARARYYFDDSSDWDINDKYEVRAVGISGKAGKWIEAEKVGEGKIEYTTLSGFGEEQINDNWKAEFSEDLKSFKPMEYRGISGRHGGDFGGTPNKEGGLEGYFMAGESAKVGRGWQQASPDGYCVRTFTAPKEGDITLSGRALKEWYHSPYGDEIDVCVMKNDEIIIPWKTLKKNDVIGLYYNMNLHIEKGDEIRFVVGKCSSELNNILHYEQNANIIGWMTNITYNYPEKHFEGANIRINCGGNELVDEGGNIWAADKMFKSGSKKEYSEKAEGFNSKLYATARTGDKVTYKIPAPAGIYAVRLCFAEMEYKYYDERVMKVSINGQVFEDALDVVHDSRASKKAFTKVYHYIVPDKNGMININLTSKTDAVAIAGIEVVPENDDIIKINCGGEEFVDWAGYVWNKDNYFEGGEAIREEEHELRQASPTLHDKELYFSARKGDEVSYKIPVKDSIYSVHIKFAELEYEEEGKRPVDIFINGCKVKENFDSRTEAGEFPMASDVRFDDISSSNGYINIKVKAKGDVPAIIRAIEID